MINTLLFKNNVVLNMLLHILSFSLQWMSAFLSPAQVLKLRQLHRKTHPKKKDRIKAILMLNNGYTYEEIAEVLILDDSTIRRWHNRYNSKGILTLLEDNYIGGTSNLSEIQKQELIEHLENTMYLTAKQICSYVKKRYKVNYTVKGMTSFLHQMGFRYKKPIHIPGKADIEAQRAFIRKYRRIKRTKGEDDRIYFVDGVHPMHNSQPAYGWIRKGQDMVLKANTGRQRVNLNGAYCIEDQKVVIHESDMINAQSTIALFSKMLIKQPVGKIYVVLDNARYYRSKEVQEFLRSHKRIRLIFLPPYSPNLNIFERLWKFFKKNVTYNSYYEKFAVFRKYCLDFFNHLQKYKPELQSLMSDNFQLIQA